MKLGQFYVKKLPKNVARILGIKESEEVFMLMLA